MVHGVDGVADEMTENLPNLSLKDVHELVYGLGFDKLRLLGMDIGMMVAFAYAVAYSGEVEQLILSESLIPGFGLEPLMNPATEGYWHFGFYMQLPVAMMLTADKETEYLLPTIGMMSVAPDARDNAQRSLSPGYQRKGRMRAGFQHYGRLLDDGRDNRERLKDTWTLPVLVLSGERGIPHQRTLDCVRQVADRIESDLVPQAGHLFAYDNPEWIAERLQSFMKSNRE